MPAAAYEEMESGSDEFQSKTFEFGTSSGGEFAEELETGAPFGEVEEMEMAAELLEANDEAQLDQFLGKLLKNAGRAVGGALKTPLGRILGGYLKGALNKALPNLGGVLGDPLAAGVDGATASRLASTAGRLFDLEMEGLSAEDQEFEVARRLVRFGGEAVSNAIRAQTGGAGNLAQVVQQSLLAAAREHAPGFIRSGGNGVRHPAVPTAPAACHCGGHDNRHESGSWVRRGREIHLLEV